MFTVTMFEALPSDFRVDAGEAGLYGDRCRRISINGGPDLGRRRHSGQATSQNHDRREPSDHES